MIRRDCIHYHCEHDMGASIDCCTLRGLGNCPCSNDCNDYANKNKIYLLGLDVFRKRKEASAQPEQRWIPVTERMPKDGEWCLFTDGVNVSVERYKEDALDHFFPPGRWFNLEDAIAWMPLPAPYRKGGLLQ